MSSYQLSRSISSSPRYVPLSHPPSHILFYLSDPQMPQVVRQSKAQSPHFLALTTFERSLTNSGWVTSSSTNPCSTLSFSLVTNTSLLMDYFSPIKLLSTLLLLKIRITRKRRSTVSQSQNPQDATVPHILFSTPYPQLHPHPLFTHLLDFILIRPSA
jgi:hypothetical protein